jgi:N-acetylneuraminate synthase
MAKKKIDIAGRMIGDNEPIFMIAEIGLNHNGSIEIAKRLIDAAFACNWHCVKFQKRTPDICVPENQKNVLRDTPWGRMTYLEYRRKVEFGHDEYNYIRAYCQEKPIYWTASVWDIPSLEFLLRHDVPFIKIPSAKLTEEALVREAASSGKPVILSTGMSTIEEIDKAVEILEKYAGGNYVLMHTNSSYPAPINEINLLVIKSLRERYDCIVGYSGHEYDLGPTVFAAVLGARLIERHVTLDHNMWGSDHFASLEVHAMDMLYKRIKNVDTILGDGVKRVEKQELEVRRKLRGY